MSVTRNAPTSVAQIDTITEGGFVARLTREADLDQAMLEIAHWWLTEGADWQFEEEDRPTSVPGYGWHSDELRVGTYRKVPCSCGEGHAWDLHDSKPGPGAFVAVVAA